MLSLSLMAPTISPRSDFRDTSAPLHPIQRWQELITPTIYHTRGLRWPSSVIPNNLFFFTRTHAKEMGVSVISRVLHSRHELVIAYRGSGKMVVNDDIYPIEAGTAHWVRPGEFHLYFDFVPDSFHWLFFSFDLAGDASLLPEKRVLQLKDEDFSCIDAAGRLYLEQKEDGLAVYEIARLMADFIGELHQRPSVEAMARLEKEGTYAQLALFKEIALFAHAHMDRGVRIEDLTQHLNLSEGHLRKTFRELVGRSLGAWLRNSRFARCIQLLSDGTLSISEIAQLSGFETIHSFSQAFSKRIGMAPTAYRKHLIEGGKPFQLPGNEPPSPAELSLLERRA